MRLNIIGKSGIKEAASILVNYWKERGMNYSQKWAEKYIKEGHKKEIKKDIFFTVKEDGKLLGTVSIVIYEGNVAELRDLVIKKKFRNKGYAKKAIYSVINYCIKNKIRKIYALILTKNIRLFKNCKFTKEGYLKNHFKHGEDLIIVSRYLK